MNEGLDDFEKWLLSQKDREDDIGCLGQDIELILKWPGHFRYKDNNKRYNIENLRWNCYGVNAQLALLQAKKEYDEIIKD